MAKVYTEVLVVKLSKLVKDSSKDVESSLTEEMIAAIEQVAQELSPDGVVVEVEAGE